MGYAGYQKLISEILAKLGKTGYDPRHIEGLMLLEYGTLSHLDKATFKRETKICIEAIDQMGKERAEANAKSYGL